MALKSVIKRRVFIVGCPRSGTTLLQSLLAAHSQIYSFPESQFFPFLFSNDRADRFLTAWVEPQWSQPLFRLAARKLIFGAARSRLQTRIQEFLADIDQLSYLENFPTAAIASKVAYTQAFWHVLDKVTQAQAKVIWLEKSPLHLYYLDYIAQHIPDVIFIHILRSGADTIASLYDVRQRYSDQWKQTQATPENCTNEWIQATKISQRYRHQPNHLVLTYEQLVQQTEAVMLKLCQAIEVEFEPNMLTNYSQVARQVSLRSEPWKQQVQQPIQNQNATKFTQLFTPEERQQILNRIQSLDVAAIANLQI